MLPALAPSLDNLDAAIVLLDSSGVILWANSAWHQSAEQRGLHSSWIGMNYLEFVAQSDSDAKNQQVAVEGLKAVLDGRQSFFQHEYSCDYLGEQRWYVGSYKSVGDGSRNVIIAHNDVTEIHSTFATVQNENFILQSAFDAAPLPMFLVNFDRTFLRVNPACLNIFGYGADELIGKSTRMLYATTDEWIAVGADIEKSLAGNRCQSKVFSMRRKSGEVFSALCSGSILLDHNGNPACAIAALQDISTELAKEEDAQRSRRLESLGRLAGEVAHDLNNLLTIIRGNAALLADDPVSAKAHQRVSEIQHAVNLATDLASRLGVFSGSSTSAAVKLSLNDVLQGLVFLLQRLLGDHVEIELALETTTRLIKVRRADLENAIINLAANARDAMEGVKVSRLTIETENFDVVPIAASDRLPEGRYVRLSIRDTGCGMSEEVKKRAFDPFYSTKDRSRSSGLGLTSVYGFVAQSRGRISIESSLGCGTEVVILFPEAAGLDDRDQQRGASRQKKSVEILLVDDNVSVRRVAYEMLSGMGYGVREAHDGPTALNALSENPAIDLVISDMVMPGMSGEELAAKILDMSPGMKILFITGYRSHFSNPLQNGLPCLFKPYSYGDLASAVENVLTDA